MSSQKVPITVAYGDGIGPEIMAATLEILTGGRSPNRARGHRDRREGLSAGDTDRR